MNEKAALLMGWRVGQLLRAMRGRIEEPEQPDQPEQSEYEVVFENGVLYIKRGPATQWGDVLSFRQMDFNWA